MIRIYFLLILVGISIQCKNRNSVNVEENLKYVEITDFIQLSVEALNIPGLTIAITQNNKVMYNRAFGVKSVETKDKLNTEHFFHFASVSKPIVATAIMQLVEQSKLSLDDKLTAHVPYFKIDDEEYRDITIRQVLNHTSGLGDVYDYEWDNPQYDIGAAEKYVKSLSEEKLRFTPATDWAYSNLAFDIMGDVIAKVSGMPFETFIKENILRPLEMVNSSYIYPEIPENLRTSTHVWNGSVTVSEVYPYNRIHAPSSTLNSSVLEMSHWAIANLNRGLYKNRRILNEESYELLWTNSVNLEDKPEMGLSWFLGEHKGTRTVSHGGGDTGYRSYFVMLPDNNTSVIIASNYQLTPVGKIVNGVLDILLGYEPKPIK